MAASECGGGVGRGGVGGVKAGVRRVSGGGGEVNVDGGAGGEVDREGQGGVDGGGEEGVDRGGGEVHGGGGRVDIGVVRVARKGPSGKCIDLLSRPRTFAEKRAGYSQAAWGQALYDAPWGT